MSLARMKMMAEKLYIEVQYGRVENEWAETFICDVRERLVAGKVLTNKQIEKLEELFEKY